MIFRPACFAPIILIATTLLLAFIVFAPLLNCQCLGEHFNVTGFISAAGISVTAWLHFLHRRKIWEDSLKGLNRRRAKLPEAPNAEFDAPTPRAWLRRETAYVCDYFNFMRALRDRKRDKIIEADTVERKGTDFPEIVLTTMHLQDEAKAVNFLKETYRKPPPI